MEKYGVVTDNEKTKTGSTGQRCPKCGRAIDPATPGYCKECGTEGFEKRPTEKK